MSTSIFITRKIPEIGIKMLEEKGYRVDVYPKDEIPSQAELISYLKNYPYDAILCLLTDSIDKNVFDAVPSLKMVATYTVGFNNIDIAEASKRNIIVTNTAGASRIPVAEHAIALMFALTTRLVEADTFTRNGNYKGWAPMAFIGTDVSNKVIGLVGTGAIGAEVARMAYKGFDAEILYYDVVANEHIEKEYKATRCATLEELLTKSDIVSLHVPLLDSTHHIINSETLKCMKPTAFLINTSRGPIIDEAALVHALKNKTIAGAGLDVYENEPALASGLTSLSNVVLTPHIASARQQARNEMSQIAAQNIIDFFEGKVPLNKVTH